MSSTRIGQCQKFEKFSVGVLYSSSTPKVKIFARSLSSCSYYLRVRFDILSSVKFRGINGSPNWGPRTLIRGHPRGSRVVPFDFTDMISISHCTRGCILHRFRDIAFDMSKVTLFGYPSCVQPPTEGFRWEDLLKILYGGQRMATVQNGVETLPKISTG